MKKELDEIQNEVNKAVARVEELKQEWLHDTDYEITTYGDAACELFEAVEKMRDAFALRHARLLDALKGE